MTAYVAIDNKQQPLSSQSLFSLFPLLSCLRIGDLEAIEDYMAIGKGGLTDGEGRSALHYAVAYDKPAAVQVRLGRWCVWSGGGGGGVEGDAEGLSLSKAYVCLLSVPVLMRCPPFVRLLGRHCWLTAAPPLNSTMPTHICCRALFLFPPLQALLANGANTAAVDMSGNPPLHYAAGCAW